MKKIFKAAILVIGIAIIISLYYSQSMKKVFKKEVIAALERTKGIKPEILTESDIQHLPPAVQKYMR